MKARRVAVLVVVVLAVLPVVSLAAVDLAAADNHNGTATPTPTTTATPTPTPTPTPTATPTATPEPNESAEVVDLEGPHPGSYTYDELTRPGELPGEEELPSTRLLADNTPVLVRATSPNPLRGEFEPVEAGSELQSTRLQFESARYGREDIQPANYTLIIVYWQEATRSVEDGNTTTTEPYAANQTVERKRVTFSPYRDITEFELQPHYDQQWQVTMMLQQDGDSVARWRFTQKTIAYAQSPEIESWGDLLFAGLLFFIGPAIATGGVGIWKSEDLLKKTAAGPMLGYGPYIGMAVLGILIVTFIGWFKFATFLTRAPYTVGILLGLAFIIAYVEKAGRPDTSVEFTRRDLENVKDGNGKTVKDGLMKHRRTVRVAKRDRDSKLLIVRPGLRPFLARYFGEPAAIEDEHLVTEVHVNDQSGNVEREYLADPLEEQPLVVTYPEWEFDFPLFDEEYEPRPALEGEVEAPERERDDAEGYGDMAVGAAKDARNRASREAQTVTREVREFTRRLNVNFVMKAALALSIGYIGATILLGMPSVGIALGLVPVVAMCYSVRDGYAVYYPAPTMMTRALETLARAQDDYREARSYEAARSQLWKERIRRVSEIEDLRDDYDRTLMDELFGRDEKRRAIDHTENGDSPADDRGEERRRRRERDREVPRR